MSRVRSRALFAKSWRTRVGWARQPFYLWPAAAVCIVACTSADSQWDEVVVEKVEVADSRVGTIIVNHWVGDLTRHERKGSFRISASEDDAWDASEEKLPWTIEADDLVRLVQSNVAPQGWRIDGTSIVAGDGYLLITHTASVQEAVRDFLGDLRRFNQWTLPRLLAHPDLDPPEQKAARGLPGAAAIDLEFFCGHDDLHGATESLAMPMIDGHVTDTDLSGSPPLVTIDRGASDGVREGFTFDIYSGGRYKGQILVRTVGDHTCTGIIVKIYADRSMDVGDDASTRI